jgi:hypothetical protein
MKKSHLTTLLLLMVLLISACAPKQTPSNADNSAQQIETSVALTVAAREALTAAAVPLNTNTPLPPTDTPFPTLTPYPTLTPFVVTPGSGSGSGSGSSGGGAGPTQDPRYVCQLIDQVPLDGSPDTIMKTGEKLDVKWTLKNVGLNKWEAATFGWIAWKETVRSDIPDNKLLTTSPAPLSGGLGGVDILPKKFVTLGVELTAPATFQGQDPIYITVQMALVAHGTKFCTPYIQVEIIRPGMTP